MKRIMIPMAVAVAAAIVTGARAEVSPKAKALAEIAACDSLLVLPGLTAAERDSVVEEKAYQYALATMYAMRADEYREALAYIDSGLPIATDPDVRGPLLTFRAKAYTFLGDDGLDYARHDEAIRNYDLAIEAYRELGSQKDVARIIGKKADVYSNNKMVTKAEETQARAWQEARESGDQTAMVPTLTRIKNFARQFRRHTLYLAANHSLDSIRPYVTDPGLRMDIAADFAETATTSGDFDGARAIYTSVLSEQDAMPEGDEKNLLLTGTIDHLADLCFETGDYDAAIGYNLRNLALKRSGNTESRFGQSLVFNRLSENYAAKGDTVTARLYADSVISVITPETDPFYASYMYVLGGICYRRTHDYQKAYDAFVTGMGLDDSHHDIFPLVSMTLSDLGRAEEGIDIIRSYAEEVGAEEGYDSPNYAKMLRYTAQIEQSAGHKEEAAASMIKSMDVNLGNIRSRLRFIPSGMRASFISALTDLVAIMSEKGISDSIPPSRFTTAAYEGLLLNKGLLLASEQSTAELVNRHGSDADKADFDRMERIRARLEHARKNPALKDSVARLYAEMMAIDGRLAHNCASYGDIGAFGSTGYRDILALLHPGETLVDITSYEKTPANRKYVAYILRSGEKDVTLIPLCTQEAIDSLRAEAGGDLSRLHSDPLASRLRQVIFDPLVPYLTPGKMTYLVPSGSLLSFSTSVLPLGDGSVEEGGEIVADRYPIVRLSSARNIVNPAAVDTERLTARLYGGIIYDVDPEEMAAASADVPDDMAAAFAMRSPQSHDHGLEYLPYTLREVNEIDEILSPRGSVSPLTGKEATEASFVNLSGRSPEILHMATHGFYFNPDDRDKARGLDGVTDPMNLSGLVMSGGNAEWMGLPIPADTYGGLLTAADIARCDLSGTSLVCLSACHSARGSETTSEGLYGLQRAFKKAGAGTLVMSLWEASEKSATLFMSTFYSELALNGFDSHKAFDKARSVVRERYPEPFYWAGFILVD